MTAVRTLIIFTCIHVVKAHVCIVVFGIWVGVTHPSVPDEGCAGRVETFKDVVEEGKTLNNYPPDQLCHEGRDKMRHEARGTEGKQMIKSLPYSLFSMVDHFSETV